MKKIKLKSYFELKSRNGLKLHYNFNNVCIKPIQDTINTENCSFQLDYDTIIITLYLSRSNLTFN